MVFCFRHENYNRKEIRSAEVFLEYGRALFENAKHEVSSALRHFISATLEGTVQEDEDAVQLLQPGAIDSVLETPYVALKYADEEDEDEDEEEDEDENQEDQAEDDEDEEEEDEDEDDGQDDQEQSEQNKSDKGESTTSSSSSSTNQKNKKKKKKQVQDEFGLAWEWLECARAIFAHAVDNDSSSSSSSTTSSTNNEGYTHRHCLIRLADTHEALGNLALETGNALIDR